MRQSILPKIFSIFLAGIVIISGLSILPAVSSASSSVVYRFDFGNQGVENGYTGVSAATRYDSSIGYGFNTPENMKNVAASGSGVQSDAVQFVTFGNKSTNTFNVDLPNGRYEVAVTLGDTERSTVVAEGVYQIINLTGNGAQDKVQIPITDGQLNLLVTEGLVGANYTLSALEITKLSDLPVTKRTIFIGGDSTVSTYYPLDTTFQAGWGQMLQQFLDPETFYVKNLASGGQFARGFRDDGQLEAILKYIKPGDYFIYQFGINDTAAKNETTASQFKDITRDVIRQIKATGATIILSTPQGRSGDFNASNVHTNPNRWYNTQVRQLATEENVPLVDLNVLSSAYFTTIGAAATNQLYMYTINDTLHINRDGATQLARIFAEDMVRQGLDGFAETTWNGNESVNAGEELDVFFGLSGVNESVAVYAQDISVNYNPNDLEFVSASSQKDGLVIADKVLTLGKARFITVYTGKSPNLSENLLKLTFRAKSDASENTIITLNTVIQSNGQGIESRLSGAAHHVQIEGTTGNPNPQPGDVNNDGRLSIGDLALIASAYGKTSADTDWDLYKKYDIVQDNIIDISDLVLMARSILDWTSKS